VRLRKLLDEIGAKYDRQLPMSSEAHRLLRRAEILFKRWIPLGYVVESSGGKGKPAVTPWIAIFHPSETTTTRNGIYLAYLFDADMRTVTLTLNQSVGQMADHLGRATARQVLTREATAIRAALRRKDIADLDTTFDLGTTSPVSIDYEHANIVSRTYSLDSLSSESRMVADLKRFIKIYASAREAREVAHRRGGQEFLAPARQPTAKPATKPPPKPTTAPVESDPPVVGLEPKVSVPREPKALVRAITRRTALASVLAASMAYVVPAVASKERDTAMDTSLPDETTPVFTIDVSQHDWARRGGNLDWTGIRHAGIAGMCARATYGDPSGYNWPTYNFGDFSRAAKAAGMGIRGGYHNIVRGDQQSINRQVDWLRRELDSHDANWAMLDVERYSELISANMWASWDDVRRFDDRWAEVDDRVLVGYIPPWNWSKHLGQPDLREFRGPVIASNYPLEQVNEHFKQLYERVGGDNGAGWAAYGSRVPEGWQFSARAQVPGAPYICDVNAWRMSSQRLKALLVGGRDRGR
jgi:hypothetical protein